LPCRPRAAACCAELSWIETTWVPDATSPLAGAIDRIWHFDGTLAAKRERVFPDGTLELIVQLDTPHRPGLDGPADRFPPGVTGLRTTGTMSLLDDAEQFFQDAAS
jgi:hypothetical protein